MIVVAIIGLLAAIAIPAYQGYVARAHVASGLATIYPLKTAVEDLLQNGTSPGAIGLTAVGVTSTANPLGTIDVGPFQSDGGGTLVFHFDRLSNPVLKAPQAFLTLTRNGTTGRWNCTLGSTASADLSKYNARACS